MQLSLLCLRSLSAGHSLASSRYVFYHCLFPHILNLFYYFFLTVDVVIMKLLNFYSISEQSIFLTYPDKLSKITNNIKRHLYSMSAPHVKEKPSPMSPDQSPTVDAQRRLDGQRLAEWIRIATIRLQETSRYLFCCTLLYYYFRALFRASPTLKLTYFLFH